MVKALISRDFSKRAFLSLNAQSNNNNKKGFDKPSVYQEVAIHNTLF